MKAKEAPEKIYLRHNHKGDIGAGWLIFPLTNNVIEYTRTDAFIEKAVRRLEHYLDNSVWVSNDVGAREKEVMIEDFRKYMKGE